MFIDDNLNVIDCIIPSYDYNKIILEDDIINYNNRLYIYSKIDDYNEQMQDKNIDSITQTIYDYLNLIYYIDSKHLMHNYMYIIYPQLLPYYNVIKCLDIKLILNNKIGIIVHTLICFNNIANIGDARNIMILSFFSRMAKLTANCQYEIIIKIMLVSIRIIDSLLFDHQNSYKQLIKIFKCPTTIKELVKLEHIILNELNFNFFINGKRYDEFIDQFFSLAE